MAEGDLIRIEVAYALPDEQVLLSLNVPDGTTAMQAVEQSGLLERFPDIELSRNELGIFGRVTEKDRVLQAGDRVEIYRPLIADPKEVRRQRAKRKIEEAAADGRQPKRNRGSSGVEL